MTARPGNDGGRDPKRPRPLVSFGYVPKPDMGPPSCDRGFIGSSTEHTRLPRSSQSRDEFVVEAIEIAGFRAEQEVVPFRRGRVEPPVTGRAMVDVVFFDRATLACFLRVHALARSQVLDTWILVRRWARANDEADLDEAVCGIVAASINTAFPGLLRASVVTLFN